MGRLIKRFSDGTYLEYDRGNFDDWCVYIVEPDGSKKPPLDREYFSDIKELSIIFGRDMLYEAYVFVYENTGKYVNDLGLEAAEKVSERFGNEKNRVHKIFTILYMAMIAEENKKFTKLGKRIKRLGIYKLLYENSSVDEAANFMRGMSWREIDSLCRERGF